MPKDSFWLSKLMSLACLYPKGANFSNPEAFYGPTTVLQFPLTWVADSGLDSGRLRENSTLSHYTNVSWRNAFPGVQLLRQRVDTLKMLSFFQKHFYLFIFHKQFLRIFVSSHPRKSWISQFLFISVRFIISQCKTLSDIATFSPLLLFYSIHDN